MYIFLKKKKVKGLEKNPNSLKDPQTDQATKAPGPGAVAAPTLTPPRQGVLLYSSGRTSRPVSVSS